MLCSHTNLEELKVGKGVEMCDGPVDCSLQYVVFKCRSCLLQCVAVSCSVLQRVVQRVAVCCRGLLCVAVRCSVLQCVAALVADADIYLHVCKQCQGRGHVLHCVEVCCSVSLQLLTCTYMHTGKFKAGDMCCSMLHCVALLCGDICCSVLLCVALCCTVLHCVAVLCCSC